MKNKISYIVAFLGLMGYGVATYFYPPTVKGDTSFGTLLIAFSCLYLVFIFRIRPSTRLTDIAARLGSVATWLVLVYFVLSRLTRFLISIGGYHWWFTEILNSGGGYIGVPIGVVVFGFCVVVSLLLLLIGLIQGLFARRGRTL